MDPSEPDNTAQQASDNRPKRDEIFYFRDVVFLVDGVLFKVPRRNFEENSEVFWTMYTLPPVAGVPDGSDDEHPLLLERISAEDFRCLLRIMFAPKYSDNQELSLDEWTAVLRLASMWQFTQIRDLVIDVLDQSISEPISRIMLARKYSITEWLIPR
ncbi:hypothetical protein A0H81_05027 [Grifola frondosa]|uniref:BTB domain-containing protein n=1 Tax=Grifola frondosa TaxID=5627 RepID=A0A1C7MDT6_GRIFR|nr:hypothetical protein A0H81_05027 [Grifola frondosa]